jgi:hypothetical protein
VCQQGPQDGRKIHPAVRLHRDADSRRQRTLGRIADNARNREGQAMALGHPSGDMRFHVDRKRASRSMQLRLLV